MSKPTTRPRRLAVFIVSNLPGSRQPISRPTTKEGLGNRSSGRIRKTLYWKEGDESTDRRCSRPDVNQEGEVIAGKDEYLPNSLRSHDRADLFCCIVVRAHAQQEHLRGSRDAPVEMYHEKTIDNILNLPIPNFSEIRSISIPINDILHTARNGLEDQSTSEEMLVELEKFIYGDYTYERKGEV